jgi:hypothetical protein
MAAYIRPCLKGSDPFSSLLFSPMHRRGSGAPPPCRLARGDRPGPGNWHAPTLSSVPAPCRQYTRAGPATTRSAAWRSPTGWGTRPIQRFSIFSTLPGGHMSRAPKTLILIAISKHPQSNEVSLICNFCNQRTRGGRLTCPLTSTMFSPLEAVLPTAEERGGSEISTAGAAAKNHHA